MKNSIAIISISVFLCISLFTTKAQDINSMRIGIKAGANLSNMSTNDASNNDMITGFNLGLFGKLPITNFIAIQPELYLTTKGAAVSYNSILMDGTARFNLTYLEIPVLCVVNITDNFNVHAGPYVAYMLNGKVKNESNITLFDFEENIDANDYNRIDAGIAIGAGIDIGAISVGARYNFGLTKVGKEQTILGATYTIPNASNSVLNLYVSLSLN